MCNHILYQKAIECLNLDKFNHVEIQWLENTNVFSIHSYNKNFRQYFAFMFITVNEYEHTLNNDPKYRYMHIVGMGLRLTFSHSCYISNMC